VQILETVNPQILFKDYRYLASSTATLSRHFQDYAKEITGRFLKPGALVVEIGCNDGVLLKPLHEYSVRAVGVEPAENIAAVARSRGCHIYNDFFDLGLARVIRNEQGASDAISANNVFAHIDDLHGVMDGIDHLLAPHGVFLFEVQCLFDLLDGCQYDMIYHEHLMYHSVHALKKFFALFGMHIFDVIRVSTHCGSIRVHVQRNSNPSPQPIEKRLQIYLSEEKSRGFDLEKTFDNFGALVREKSARLHHLVKTLNAEGKRVVGYGASGRASVHVNMSYLTPDILSYVVDNSPERIGRVMPGTHNPIVTADVFREDPPDYAVVFAYNYLEEIMRKEVTFTERGGKWIVPLPEPRIL
jgi:SAM-dependent methyltransferase